MACWQRLSADLPVGGSRISRASDGDFVCLVASDPGGKSSLDIFYSPGGKRRVCINCIERRTQLGRGIEATGKDHIANFTYLYRPDTYVGAVFPPQLGGLFD